MSYKYIETKQVLKQKELILKSCPKNVQDKLRFFICEIIDSPRDKKGIGSPEQLKHSEKELWSRELTKKDRIVYGIEAGAGYGMPEEYEIIVFYQYLGHYSDK
ncbi:MAG: type II toxin-antitoxin system YoeB family toxin [Prevotellaceae bacterium]|jgi:Txe/YoeB family toxin of Txe-Axe toxin-antitoxin module|nr:type II toxin-antitoxin system YoeB family toxin [Prevotellaceae bacterium]